LQLQNDNRINDFKPIQQDQSLIFHSDRGIQYACEDFTTHKSITRSMSRKGNYWDNAVAESFFKSLKTELIYHNKYQTKKEAALSIFEYIETFYNTKRQYKQLNNLTILEYHESINNNLKNVA
jgi:putative transposase